jgi:ABC-type transport system substrate-binding protein
MFREVASMINIMYQALEGMPEKPDYTGKTERDIRVHWLLEDFQDGITPSGAPWEVDTGQTNAQRIVLKRSTRPEARLPHFLYEVHFVSEPKGSEVGTRLQYDFSRPDRIDFAPTLTDPNTFETLQNNENIQVHNMPGWNIFYLGFYMDELPTNNINLRIALRKIINGNKQKYADLAKGAADPAEDPVPPPMDGHDPNVQEDRFDEEEVKELLKSIKSKTLLTLLYNSGSPSPEQQRQPDYVAALAEAIGVDINKEGAPYGVSVRLEGYPTWGDLVAAVKKKAGNMFIYSWHQRERRPGDPYNFLRALFHSRNIGTTNLTRYNNTKVDDYLFGPASNFREALKIIRGEAPMACLIHWKRKAAYNVRVKDLNLNTGALPADKLVGTSVDTRIVP